MTYFNSLGIYIKERVLKYGLAVFTVAGGNVLLQAKISSVINF